MMLILKLRLKNIHVYIFKEQNEVKGWAYMIYVVIPEKTQPF